MPHICLWLQRGYKKPGCILSRLSHWRSDQLCSTGRMSFPDVTSPCISEGLSQVQEIRRIQSRSGQSYMWRICSCLTSSLAVHPVPAPPPVLPPSSFLLWFHCGASLFGASVSNNSRNTFGIPGIALAASHVVWTVELHYNHLLLGSRVGNLNGSRVCAAMEERGSDLSREEMWGLECGVDKWKFLSLVLKWPWQ